MTNNKSIHDIIHDKYSCILKGYEDKIAERKKFKINLKDSKITCYLYNNGMELEEYFPDSKKTILIVYQTNGKVKMLKSFVDGSADGNCFVFNENGEISSAFIFVEGRISNVVTDKASLEKLKLDDWFLNTCESEKDVKMEKGVRTITAFIKGKQHILNIDGLYDFLFRGCIDELDGVYHNFNGVNDSLLIEKEYKAIYKIEGVRFVTRKEYNKYSDIYTLIHFDEAGFVEIYECVWDSNSNDDAHGYIAFFEDGKIVRLQHISNGKFTTSELFRVPIIKNVKAEYDVLKNKLVEAYQASKKIELELKKLHEAKDENSELKKSIAKEIEELRSKCNHKFEYYGSDSHRDYECCIFCELTR